MRPSASSYIITTLLLLAPLTHAQQKLLPPNPIPKELPAHVPDALDHFISNKKPLAKNQDILLTRQFFKYLLGLPLEAWRCSVALYKKQTLPQLAENREVFEIFKLLRKRNDDRESNFDFENHGGDFETVCDTKHGVCQGLTNLDRRMNMLAYYDPANKLRAAVPPESSPEERFKYYEKLVWNIRNDKPTVIPGFENLLHFSRDRIGRRVLLEAAVKTWASENATVGGITQVLNGIHGTIDPGEATDLVKRLQVRLSLNYNPIIYLAASYKPDRKKVRHKWIHVMQVIKISQNKDVTEVTLKDPNYPLRAKVWTQTPSGEWEESTDFVDLDRLGVLEISKDGKMKYGEQALSEVDIMPGDDIEISRFLVNTIEFCKKNPSVCVEGGVLN